jgi:mannan endo-1,4-beta-mannosidase
VKTQILIILVLLSFAACTKKKEFVTTDGTDLKIGDQRYRFLGTNLWYGINLASAGEGGDRARLGRELDRLQAIGINNLRIVGGSEGPDTEPYRMVPALQTGPGVYNTDLLDGLDYLLDELRNRKMYAVVCLNNFWNWSGGMGQYVVWSGEADTIPYPPPHPGGDWGKYQNFAASFYSNEQATKLFSDHIAFIVGRVNKRSNVAYRDDPAIMAWQLCNEPRGVNNGEAYIRWIVNASTTIKSIDKNHLVTIGSEGLTSSGYSETEPEKVHAFVSIDYITAHVWVQNWGVYDPARADSTYHPSVKYAQEYISTHNEMAKRLSKPLVLEEFGISRDMNSHDASSPTTIRDQYYREVFSAVESAEAIAGSNFWAWGGEGRPAKPQAIWKRGDQFIGDPPHEYQGWYSVFDTDTTTIAVIREFAAKINAGAEK